VQRLPLPLRFTFAFFLLPAPAAAQTANPDRVYAIKDAKIFLGEGRTLEKGTVVLRRGRIEAAGESVDVPFDAETIDGTGLAVYPGFVDAFSTLGVKAPEGASPNEAPGVDTSVTAAPAMPEALRRGLRPEFSAADAFALDEAGGKAAREAGFCAALVGPAGGILAGQSALVLLSGAPRRSALLKGGVAIHGALQSAGGGYPSTKMGVLAVLRQLFLDARHWVEARAFYERKKGAVERPPQDGTLEAAAAALDRKIPVAIEADDADDIRRAVALSKEFGFRLWIAGGREAWKVADLLKAEAIPVLLGLDFGREPRKPGERRGGGPETKPAEGTKPGEEVDLGSGAQQPAEAKPAAESRPAEAGEEGEDDDPKRVLEDRHRKWEERVACAGKLREAGVPFALTTSGTKSPKEFLESLEKAIGKGLPREAAVAALTTVPAGLFGLEDQLGAIAPGALANLVVMKGEPAEKDAKVRFVFVDGRKFEIESSGAASASSEKKEPPAPGIRLAGTWEVTMEGRRGPGGGGPTTVQIRQEGGSLSGTWTSSMGSSDLTGTLSGKGVEMSIELSFGERSFTLRLEGTVESNDRMSGEVRGGGRFGGGRGGGGKWTAVRKPGSAGREAR
jgi:imidazolonepropionase-like amidohydrolase